MTSQELVLAVLSLNDFKYTPVQIQKLFFLIDEKLGDKIGGRFFNFKPHHYGPFDAELYKILEEFNRKGYLEISRKSDISYNEYYLTHKGKSIGHRIVNKIDSVHHSYIRKLISFVTSLSFSQLVATIYRDYPEMKTNSIFK